MQKDRGLWNEIDPQQFGEGKWPGKVFPYPLALCADGDGVTVDGIHVWVRQQIIDLRPDCAGTVKIVAAQPGQDTSLATAPTLVNRVALPSIRFAGPVETGIGFVTAQHIYRLVCTLC